MSYIVIVLMIKGYLFVILLGKINIGFCLCYLKLQKTLENNAQS